MPSFIDLPDELTEMILNSFDGESADQSSFFYTRKYHEMALSACYTNLQVTVWDPASPLALITSPGHSMEQAIRDRLRVVSLLPRAILNTNRGMENTSLEGAKTVSIRLTEDNPMFLKQLCLPTPSPLSFLNPLNLTDWDRWMRDIFRRTTQATHITFDWFGIMPLTFPRRTLPIFWYNYSQLRQLSISGARGDLHQYCSFVPFYLRLPFHNRRFEVLRLENVELVHITTAVERAAAREKRPQVARQPYMYRPWRIELIDCKTSDFADCVMTGISEAKIVFSHVPLHPKLLTAVCGSTDTLDTLEILAQHPLPTTGGLRARGITSSYFLISRYVTLLKHLTVSFWVTPRDDPRLQPITKLEHFSLYIAVDDLINFNADFEAKLAVIEKLNFMPALNRISLLPSHWVPLAPTSGQRESFEGLFQYVRDAWADGKTTHVFGWPKSTRSTGRKDMFGWDVGYAQIELDVTAISSLIEKLKEMDGRQWLLASRTWLSEFCVEDN